MLTEKYGEPSECIEEFQGYNPPRDNRDKLIRLQSDKCTYSTIFETPKGSIKLSLEYHILYSSFAKLQYWDRINTAAAKANALDDL